MTSRRTMTASEIGEFYSPAPFRYDFEYLLNWAKPYTLPIVPPDSEALSISVMVAGVPKLRHKKS